MPWVWSHHLVRNLVCFGSTFLFAHLKWTFIAAILLVQVAKGAIAYAAYELIGIFHQFGSWFLLWEGLNFITDWFLSTNWIFCSLLVTLQLSRMALLMLNTEESFQTWNLPGHCSIRDLWKWEEHSLWYDSVSSPCDFYSHSSLSLLLFNYL